jgi:hypothetical protein
MTKIIVIGYLEHFKNRTDKNLYNFYCYLQKKSKFSIELYSPSDRELIIKNNGKHSIFLILPGTTLDYINELNGIKIYELMDVRCRCGIYKCLGNGECRSKEIVNYLKNNHYDYLFYHYNTYIVREQYTFIKGKFYFPHFIDHSINKDYKLEKKYDILFYGSDWAKVYPLRNKLKQLLITVPFNVYIIDYTQPIIGEELAKLINQSWITICTKSNHNLFLQKYMEVAMNHSVICGDFPDLEERVFGDSMIYLDISMSTRQITNILTRYLNDKNLLKKMSDSSYQIACEKYTYETGLSTFEKHIQSVINI